MRSYHDLYRAASWICSLMCFDSHSLQVLLSAWRDKTLAELKEIDELEGMCRYESIITSKMLRWSVSKPYSDHSSAETSTRLRPQQRQQRPQQRHRGRRRWKAGPPRASRGGGACTHGHLGCRSYGPLARSPFPTPSLPLAHPIASALHRAHAHRLSDVAGTRRCPLLMLLLQARQHAHPSPRRRPLIHVPPSPPLSEHRGPGGRRRVRGTCCWRLGYATVAGP